MEAVGADRGERAASIRPLSGASADPAPHHVLAADWSGAATGEARTLWLASARPVLADGKQTGILTDLRPRTRKQAAEAIVDAAATDPALVVGLDFSFSMPAWWLDACGLASVDELWADVDRLEGWLAQCSAPFWGRRGHRRPASIGGRPLRLTELAAPGRPGSVFQISGAGAVGTASLRGMPTLAILRAAGFAIWPFDPWTLPVVIEVWPRLAIGALVKSRPEDRRRWANTEPPHLGPVDPGRIHSSADALDAAAAALWLCERSTEVRPDIDDAVVVREGWIDGVAYPGPSTTASPAEPGE